MGAGLLVKSICLVAGLYIYLGHMFGPLTPRLVVPASSILMTLIALIVSNWNITDVPIGVAVGFLVQWLIMVALYLFIHGIIRTSGERTRLIAKLEAIQKELELARQRDTELATLRERERLARDLHGRLLAVHPQRL